MSSGGGDSFRTRSFSERVAGALPSGGRLGTVRRWLRPLLAKWLAPGGGGLRSVLPHGEAILVSPSFRHVTWNREEYAAFRAAVRPGDIVLEAGANVGAYTMLFAQWVGRSGHVYAFEPDPAAHAGLQAHIALNRVGDRVTAVAAAIADGREPRLRFAIGPSSGISRVVRNGVSEGTCEVEATSIDRFCAERGITPRIIKVDVEGAELAALQGARATIAAAGADLQLFVEMHPQLWPELGISPGDLRRECDAQGLAIATVDGRRDGLWDTEGICLRLRPARA
jgi:FkbM family methyltransferase